MPVRRYYPQMKIALASLVLVAFCTASGFASRLGSPPTTEELVSQSRWIFAGRVLRYESSASAFIGAADVKFTVLAGLPLRGTPPKRVVIVGTRSRPFDVPTNVGKVLIFFGEPLPTPYPGIDGVLRDVRPFSELKSVRALIDQSQTPK